jgi:hypothetical protein
MKYKLKYLNSIGNQSVLEYIGSVPDVIYFRNNLVNCKIIKYNIKKNEYQVGDFNKKFIYLCSDGITIYGLVDSKKKYICIECFNMDLTKMKSVININIKSIYKKKANQYDPYISIVINNNILYLLKTSGIFIINLNKNEILYKPISLNIYHYLQIYNNDVYIISNLHIKKQYYICNPCGFIETKNLSSIISDEYEYFIGCNIIVTWNKDPFFKNYKILSFDGTIINTFDAEEDFRKIYTIVRMDGIVYIIFKLYINGYFSDNHLIYELQHM